MEIIILLLGVLGWIISINGWFIIPAVVYKGFMILGLVWIIIKLILIIIGTIKIWRS